MRRLAETATFSALAILIHVALFAQSSDDGEDSGGAGGTEVISLEAADATVAEMVEAWDRPPPETPVREPDLLPAPAQDTSLTNAPRMDLADAPRADVRMSALPPTAPEVLQLDREAALPRPEAGEPDILRPKTPDAPMSAPDLPRPEMSRPERHVPMATALPEQIIEAPSVDIQPAPPPPSEIAPTASLRPTQRPSPTDLPETARKAEQTSPGRAAQRAAGSGGSSQAGQAGRAETTTVSKGEQARAQAVWGARIRSKIEHAKRYPRGTNASGQVSLAISISRTGALLGVSLQRSSGNSALDRAALDAVRRAGRFPPAPRELPRDAYTFALAIVLKR